MKLPNHSPTQPLYKCNKVKSSIYYNGIEKLQFLAVPVYGYYAPLEKHRLKSGPDKGEIKIILTDKDYTQEHEKRKTKWKVSSSSKSLGHITKVFLKANDRACGDFKGTNDLILFEFFRDEMSNIISFKMYFLPGQKNNHPLISCFLTGRKSFNIPMTKEGAL